MDLQRQLYAYLDRYGIHSIRLQPDTGVDEATPVCNVFLALADKVDEPDVLFKLQGADAGFSEFISAIDAKGAIEPGPAARGLPDSVLNDQALALLGIIEPRVIRIKQEEDIQAITFVGNTFLLNRVAEIRVLEDDGEGHLSIELHREGTVEQAVMLANDLMDGLYLGSIREKTAQ